MKKLATLRLGIKFLPEVECRQFCSMRSQTRSVEPWLASNISRIPAPQVEGSSKHVPSCLHHVLFFRLCGYTPWDHLADRTAQSNQPTECRDHEQRRQCTTEFHFLHCRTGRRSSFALLASVYRGLKTPGDRCS